MKDLTTGKLDSPAQVGHFIGYDSESEGYHIYWPHKHTVTVEQNVIFNEDDVLIKTDSMAISSDILAEGERETRSSCTLLFQNPKMTSLNYSKIKMNQKIIKTWNYLPILSHFHQLKYYHLNHCNREHLVSSKWTLKLN